MITAPTDSVMAAFTWAHLVWLPVFMALGTGLAHLLWHIRNRPNGPGHPRTPRPGRVAWVSLAFGGAFAAFALWFRFGDHTTLLYYTRGLLSEPSMGLVAISLFYLAHWGWGHPAIIPAARRLLGAAAILGIGLYPLALGIGYFDPYALGYRPELAVAVAVLAIPMWWWAPLRGPALWLTLALLVWGRGHAESDNLWDLLIDPILVIIGLSITGPRLVVWGVRRWHRERPHGAAGPKTSIEAPHGNAT